MTPIRIAILGDDLFFREGLTRLLSTDPSLTLISDDLQSLHVGAANSADVLLVDSRIEGALERCRSVEAYDRPRVLLLMVANDEIAVEALAAGARGVVRKSEPIADVVRAIPVVHRGSIWAPRDVVVQVWLRHRRGATSVAERLSAREYEVVRSVASGLSNKELAAQLGISSATVKAHLTSVFQKLGVSGRGELIAAYHGTKESRPRPRSSYDFRRPS